MARMNDPMGDLVRDAAIALGLAYLAAWIWGGVGQGSYNPLVGAIAMVSIALVHGWLVVSTLHGPVALAVLLALGLFAVRFVPAGWPRRAALLALLLAWGAYVIVAPELLGDGL